MQVFHASCGTHLIPQAFPALKSLTLTAIHLGDVSLFSQLDDVPTHNLTSLCLRQCSIDSEATQHAVVALAQLPGLRALHLEYPDAPAPVGLAEQLTGLTSLTISTDGAVMDEQQVAVAAQNQALRSLSLVNEQLPGQVLQPEVLCQVLTSCTGLTQLTLPDIWIDDQGLEVLLTRGTSITNLTLGETILTTSKADWGCSWRKLKVHGELQEFAYLPLKSVQQLHPYLGNLYLPPNTPVAQLPDLLHQATTNLASCPAWVKAPPSELTLSGGAQYLTSDQRLQLLQALAPVAGRHVSKPMLDVNMQLGGAEVEALASSLAESLTILHLNSATLLDSFWRPLAQRFTHLQELRLDSGIKADAMSVATYLVMFSSSAAQGFMPAYIAFMKRMLCITQLQVHSACLAPQGGCQAQLSAASGAQGRGSGYSAGSVRFQSLTPPAA
jgi:hypothetical protein